MSKLADEYALRCSVPSDMQENMRDLYGWALWWAPARICELGVRAGNSTVAFLTALEAEMTRGQYGHLWSFDLEDPEVPDVVRDCPWWTFTRADARDPGTPWLLPDQVDVLFLDTDPHTYESTYTDLEFWAPRVARGGVILAHDADTNEFPDVPRALGDYVRNARAQGRHYDFRVKEGRWGLGILRYR